MLITLLQENLNQALRTVRAALPRKPSLPILGTVLLKAESNKVTLYGTDLYMGIKTTVLAEVSKSGVCAVPAAGLYELVSSLPPGKLTLRVTDTVLELKTPTVLSKLTLLPPDEYPDFPEPGLEKIGLTTKILPEIIKQVVFAASKDETRPTLTGVLLTESAEVVATDGFRLVKWQLPEPLTTVPLLVPTSALIEVAKLVARSESLITNFDPQAKQLSFTFDETFVTARLLDGQYPPYQKIIPDSFEIEIEVDGAQLHQQLKTAQIFAKQSSQIVKLEISANSIKIEAQAATLGHHQGTVPAQLYTGELAQPIVVAFNNHYLLDLVTTQQPNSVVLKVNEPLQPVQLYIPEKPDYTYIVMPFRVSG